MVLGALNFFFPLLLFRTEAPAWVRLCFILFPMVLFLLLQQQCECQLAITIFGVI